MRTLGADECPPPKQGGRHRGTGKGSQGVALSPPLLLSQEGKSLGHRPADSAIAEGGFPHATGSHVKKPDLRLGTTDSRREWSLRMFSSSEGPNSFAHLGFTLSSNQEIPRK